MLANIIIVVLAVIGISDGVSFFKTENDSKLGVEIPKPADYNEKSGADRGGWDRN